MRWLVTLANVMLFVLSLAAVGLLGVAIHRRDASPDLSSAETSATAPERRQSVAFIGDGWTSGASSGGMGSTNYTARLAVREGWRVTNTSVYGSGFVAGDTLGAQLQYVAKAAPQKVIVTGGRADLNSDPTAVGAAAGRLLQSLRAQLPRAAIIVIGPMWLGDGPPLQMFRVRDAILAAAVASKVPFVDPIAEKWFIGRDGDGITTDGVNLNDRGHEVLGELVVGAMQRLGTMPG